MTAAELRAEAGRIMRETPAPPQAPKPETAPPEAYPTDEAGQFVGVAMTSKYPGRCCVCGGEYAVGDQIVYDYDSRRAGHLGCGRARPRGQK